MLDGFHGAGFGADESAAGPSRMEEAAARNDSADEAESGSHGGFGEGIGDQSQGWGESPDFQVRLGPMPFIRRHGECAVGSSPTLNLMIESGFLHM